jgi:hypothetical protein
MGQSFSNHVRSVRQKKAETDPAFSLRRVA